MRIEAECKALFCIVLGVGEAEPYVSFTLRLMVALRS
jgi:hypothetical protein